MKKTIQLILLAMGFLGFCSTAFSADLKIATLDMQKVFDSYYRTKQAKLVLSNDIAEIQKGHKSMVDQLNQKKDDYKKALDRSNEQDISQDERDKSKKEAQDIVVGLQEMDTAIREYDSREEARLGEKRTQTIKAIVSEIRGVQNDMAKRAGYSLVLDRSGETSPGVSVVLYSSGLDDMTDDLIKQLNAAAPATTPAADATPPTK